MTRRGDSQASSYRPHRQPNQYLAGVKLHFNSKHNLSWTPELTEHVDNEKATQRTFPLQKWTQKWQKHCPKTVANIPDVNYHWASNSRQCFFIRNTGNRSTHLQLPPQRGYNRHNSGRKFFFFGGSEITHLGYKAIQALSHSLHSR